MQAFCAVVDWGTSSFRLWLIDSQGQVLAGRRSNEGMAHCAAHGFAPVLEAHLAALGACADLPVMICGMAGARQGWAEAAYLDTPARLSALAQSGVAVASASRPVRILPGIAQRDAATADVMRGEETQLLGAFGDRNGRTVACMPGTHSKWVEIDDGAVLRFTSAMTGEIYAALRHHTILGMSVPPGDEAHDGEAFAHGVQSALARPESLVSLLFGVRGREILGFAPPQAAPSAISGLLIGSEIAHAKSAGYVERRIELFAAGVLGARYEEAFALAGIEYGVVDAEAAVIAGLCAAARAWLAA